jgi:hypothetical protein
MSQFVKQSDKGRATEFFIFITERRKFLQGADRKSGCKVDSGHHISRQGLV